MPINVEPQNFHALVNAFKDIKAEKSSSTDSTTGTVKAESPNGIQTSDITSQQTVITNMPVSNDQIPISGAAPDLDPPNEQAMYKLNDATTKFINMMGKANSGDFKGLFILYQLLKLLQDAINEMNISMSNMQQLETLLAVANIQKEADTLESAAKWGLVMGLISGAIQIGSSAVSLVGGIKGMAQAKQSMNDANAMKANTQQMETINNSEPAETLERQDAIIKNDVPQIQPEAEPNINENNNVNHNPNIDNVNNPGDNINNSNIDNVNNQGDNINNSNIDNVNNQGDNINNSNNNIDDSHSISNVENQNELGNSEQNNLPASENVPKQNNVPEQKGNNQNVEPQGKNADGNGKLSPEDKAKIDELKGQNNNLKTLIDVRNNFINSQQTKYQGIAGIANGVATMFKTAGEGEAGMKQADAKRISAQTQMLEQEAQKTKDLTTAVKELFQSLLSLTNSVRTNEHDANSQIFRGI